MCVCVCSSNHRIHPHVDYSQFEPLIHMCVTQFSRFEISTALRRTHLLVISNGRNGRAKKTSNQQTIISQQQQQQQQQFARLTLIKEHNQIMDSHTKASEMKRWIEIVYIIRMHTISYLYTLHRWSLSPSTVVVAAPLIILIAKHKLFAI